MRRGTSATDRGRAWMDANEKMLNAASSAIRLFPPRGSSQIEIIYAELHPRIYLQVEFGRVNIYHAGSRRLYIFSERLKGPLQMGHKINPGAAERVQETLQLC